MRNLIKSPWMMVLIAILLIPLAHYGMLANSALAAGMMVVGNISFNNIPTNIRVPLFYAEMDNSQAGYFSQTKRALMIGQMLSTGNAMAGTPYLVSRTDNAKTLFGRGSMLARMHDSYRQNDSFGEVWCIPVADAGAGVAATGTITVAGTASAAGTIQLYIAGQQVSVGVALNDAAATIATSIAAAITAAVDLPVNAAAVGAVVTLTCKWKGATGNDIMVLDSYRGFAGGETLPTGITLAYVAMASGATNPLLAPAITAMGDIEYDYVIHPYTDSTSMDTIATEMNDLTGRWCWARQIYGHVYTALRGTLSTLQAAGALRNDQHNTIAGFEMDVCDPCWEYAAAYGARNAVFLNADVARPTQTGQLVGILCARPGKRFLLTERQTLLTNGIATSFVSSGTACIERAITTYQKNAFGQSDPSYLDSETMHQSSEVIRRLRSIVTSKYARHKLAADGTRFGPGQAIVTPSVMRGELVAEYGRMELDGLVENGKLFAQYLIVEIDANNPNRMNVLFPPDYVNQLRVFAVLNQFRLQYPVGA